MPIQIACDACGKKYRFADERAGETVECKACGADIDLPSRRSGGKQKRKKQSAGGGSGVLIGGGIGALVLIGVVALLMGRRQLPAVPANVPAVDQGQVANANLTVPTQNTTAATSTSPVAQPNGGQTSPAVAANPATATPSNSAAKKSGFNKKQNQVGFKPIKAWKVQIDPPAEPVVLDDATKFNIKTVSGFLPENFVTYPETPSPFVLVGQNTTKQEGRDIWDLATGSKVNTVKGIQISGSNPGLSADGAYVAWLRFATGGSGIEVYDVKGKKSLGAVDVDSKTFNVARVCLPTSKRIVALSNVHHGIIAWKIPSGELECEIKLGNNGQPDPRHAFSPGGKYLAVVADFLSKAVDIYDLDSGEKAGSIEFDSHAPELCGMCFARDGKQLAAAYADAFTDKAERIVVWNVADGAIVKDFQLPNPEQRTRDITSSTSSLQWFPDGKRLLLNGMYVIDCEAQNVVFAFPKPSLNFPTALTRRIVTDQQIASWEGTNKSATISPLELKTEDIARARQIAAEGGLMIDAKLPKLTVFKREQAANRTAMDATWKATVDPGQTEGKFGNSLPLKAGNGRPLELEFSRPDAAIACVRMADEEDESKRVATVLVPRMNLVISNNRTRMRIKWPVTTGRTNWLEVYDLKQRTLTNRVDVDFPCELLAVSPEGTRMLVQATEGEGRLDVFAVDGTHVAGCRPYQDEDDKLRRQIASAVFLDENTIAACNMNDQMVVIRLPSCEPAYIVDDAGTVAVSPGRNLIATCAEKRLELRDALTGEARGAVPVEGDVQALSFSMQGDRLAALTTSRSGTAIVIVDLSDGSATTVPTPQATAPLIWCGENELLVGSPNAGEMTPSRSGLNVDRVLMLVDLNRKAVMWSYLYGTQDEIIFGQKTFDGRFWMASSSGKGKSRQMNGISLPEPATKKMTSDKKMEAVTLVRPGATVSLKFDVVDAPGIDGFVAKARALIDSAIKNNDLTIKDGSPVQLVVSIAPSNATGTVQMKSFGNVSGQQGANTTIQRKVATVRVAFESAGKAVWESKHDVGNDVFGLIQVQPGQDLQTVLDKQMWERTLSTLRMNLPPTHIFTPEAARGLGTSRLTEVGSRSGGK